MEIDLSRPPRSPRRSGAPAWLGWAVVWTVGIALFFLILWVVNGPRGESWVLVLAPGMTAVAGLTAVLWIYYRTRYGGWVLSPPLSMWQDAFPDTDETRRAADEEERAAYHRLRSGRISRREYEKIIAYRRFVHGEISRAEYHRIVDELDAAPAPGNRAKTPGASPSEGNSSPTGE